MSKTVQRFTYRLFDGNPKGPEDLPFPSHVHIQLQSWTTVHDTPTLTAQLMTEAEIDTNVSLLKADLDHVATLAKRALAKAKGRK